MTAVQPFRTAAYRESTPDKGLGTEKVTKFIGVSCDYYLDTFVSTVYGHSIFSCTTHCSVECSALGILFYLHHFLTQVISIAADDVRRKGRIEHIVFRRTIKKRCIRLILIEMKSRQ